MTVSPACHGVSRFETLRPSSKLLDSVAVDIVLSKRSKFFATGDSWQSKVGRLPVGTTIGVIEIARLLLETEPRVRFSRRLSFAGASSFC